ncbi:hypothetical protein AFLA_002534 [Aspergillus flavus NRRL3357]|nr:hypothetical protein AFLA_002534 [Aspergillus flavus NRRL3357]
MRLIIGGNDIKYAIDRSKVQWRDTNRVTIQTLLSSRSLSPRIASRPCKIIIEGSQQGPEWATITPQGVSLETQPVVLDSLTNFLTMHPSPASINRRTGSRTARTHPLTD